MVVKVRHVLPALVALASLTVAGCAPSTQASGETSSGTAAGNDTSTSASSTPTPTQTPVVMTADPVDGAKNVKVDTLVKVTASDGDLSAVTITGKGKDTKGKAFTDKIAGKLADDKTSWKASTRLEPGATYTVTMTGTNSEGTEQKTTSTFSTQNLTLKQQTYASVYPVDGETYGVGMPIVVRFDIPVKNKAEFQKHMKVTSSPSQTGTWSWISSTEVHYRPKDYWKPGTKVTMVADINSLNAGGGVYGQESRKLSFKIGRSVITKVNLQQDYAGVYINGKKVRTIPVSGGKPGFTTRSGTKLITEKLAQTKMRSETIGIGKDSPEAYDLDVKYAMRITDSGEFVHAAPWNAGNFGRRNASHGCVGMSTANAGWLFNQVRVGDVVVVTGTGRGLEQGNGLTDWNVSWKTFKKGSAL